MAISRKRMILIVVFAIIAVTLVVLAMSKLWIEEHFTYGIYPYTSQLQRYLTGKIPFSIGDVIYLSFLLWVIYIIVRNVYLLFVKKLTIRISVRKLSKFVLFLLFLYVFFLLIWGLNYSRKGIRHQLGLERPAYQEQSLFDLQDLMIKEVNKAKKDWLAGETDYPAKRDIFKMSALAYNNLTQSYPFLEYRNTSVKSTLFGGIENYLGFTGYYNPFTGEAQVNTSVPIFLVPNITLHEIAHQIGYAKENEANFVGFFVGTQCQDALFRYSSWLDIFMYTNAQVRFFDSTRGSEAMERLIPEVKADIETWRKFSRRHNTFIQPMMHWVYGKFLELNKQPQGIRSYDAVVSLVVAYYKKKGML